MESSPWPRRLLVPSGQGTRPGKSRLGSCLDTYQNQKQVGGGEEVIGGCQQCQEVGRMLLTTLLVLLVMGVFYRQRSARCTSKRSLRGTTAIITGASSGIGKETARDLARRGARVILACRNLVKSQMVADEIVRSTGNREVVTRELDTADLQSVREFAQEILHTERAIHVLVNNAGIIGSDERRVTQDGLEMTMATNHYGHFLLTNLLLKRLKKSAPSRIINVASTAHIFTMNVNPRDLNFERKPYSSLAAYAQSKLCNILFTCALAEKLCGSGVTVNALHPGTVSTDFFIKDEVLRGKFQRVFAQVVNFLVRVTGKDSELGAQTTIHLAVAEELENVSGKYFEECKVAACSALAKDRTLAKSLWEVSEVDVKLRPAEMCY